MVKTVDGRALNVKSENVRRLDVPAAEAPSASSSRQAHAAVASRSPDETPSRDLVESHNLTHIPYAGWCEICINAKSKSDHHVESEPKPIPMVQMDYQYMSATGKLCSFQAAKATALAIVEPEQGEVAVTQVAQK